MKSSFLNNNVTLQKRYLRVTSLFRN
uniref:Uncharacterized protein n=1 Tax=Anguilla anguilla TaxID=7936 RepID=A0A0E9VQ10_ANGAN